jgi:ATP-dependent exoDNAse (exonuclease V) beta subunit
LAPAVPVELLLTDRRAWNGSATTDLPDVAHALPAAPRWRHAEARLLAQRIAEIVHAGEARAGEVAVLLRALSDLPVYQRALEQRGLRTLAGVGSFWGQQQISDLLAYLRLLANPLDELALYSTLASPLAGISSDGLVHLARAATAHGAGVWATARALPPELCARLDDDDQRRLERFAAYLQRERAHMQRRPIAELLLRALHACAYETHLLALPDGSRRLANVHKLLRLARRYEAQEGRLLRGFLDYVEHARVMAEGAAAEPEAPVGEEQSDAVRLLSIHAAKGLEFPIVCLADLGRSPRAPTPDLLVQGARIGVRLPQLDGSAAVATLDYEELLRDRRLAEAAEEERIFYVAATRARERLLLSGAVDFQRWPSAQAGAAPIAWLAPALNTEIPALASAAAGCAVHERLPVGDGDGGGAWMRCLLNTPATFGTVLRAFAPDPPTCAPALNDPPAHPQPAPLQRPRPQPLPPQQGASALSYTSLSERLRCGYRYYLEHVLGLPEDHSAVRGPRRLQGRQWGILIHRAMQTLDFSRPRVPPPAQLQRLARELGVALTAPALAELTQLLTNALHSELFAQRLAGASHALREYPFAFALAPDQPLVTGTLDLLVRLPHAHHLVLDYKSDRLHPDEDPHEVVMRDYAAQRLIYALAALRAGAQQVEVVHWFLERPHQPASATFSAAQLPQLERQLHAHALRAQATGYAVSPAPHRGLCLTCPGRATLCSWGSTHTLRPVAPAPAAAAAPALCPPESD